MDNSLVRTVENGVATGNHKGQPFNYYIKEQRLRFCDALGKEWANQEYAERFALELDLRNHFSEENNELQHNVARNNQ